MSVEKPGISPEWGKIRPTFQKSSFFSGVKIALDLYSVPLAPEEFDVDLTFSLSEAPLPSYCEQGFEYLALSSKIQDRYDVDPERYAENLTFRRTLQERATEVYQVAPVPWRIAGPTVTIYSMAGCQDW